MSLPPIMQTPGLRLVSIGEMLGMIVLKFTSPDEQSQLRSLVVWIATRDVTYLYSWLDEKTKTAITYIGPHGDPTKDDRDVFGINLT